MTPPDDGRDDADRGTDGSTRGDPSEPGPSPDTDDPSPDPHGSAPAGPFGGDRFVLAASVASLSAVDSRVREHADLVEFRGDLAADDGRDPVAALEDHEGSLPVLYTDRRREEGGAAGPERIDRIRDAIDRGVAAVDVELATVRSGPGADLLERAHDRGVATVVSVHDFEGTPGRDRMSELLEAAADRGTVGKLAVAAADRGDVLDLLAVTHDATTGGRRVATTAMGAAGRHSRAVTPLYGSRIGYAPPDPAGATAPGQYDLATLSGLLADLGVDRPDGSPAGAESEEGSDGQ